MPLALDKCDSCGAGFLDGATTSLSTRLPVVGDIGRMSQGQRMIIAAGIGMTLMVILVLVFFIGGLFL